MAKPSTPTWIVKDLLENWDYFQGKTPAIPALWVKGRVPLFLVLGENASGKSFFRRLVLLSADRNTSIEEVIHISMEGRSGGFMYGPARAMVYGDENTRSTGECAARTVTTAIRTCADRSHPHLMYWDEPDVGMSEGAAAGAGAVIAEFAADLPKDTKGVFITTHSRVLVEQLMAVRPHYIHLGVAPDQAPQTLEEWLKRPIVPVAPEALCDASHKRFLAIQKILDLKRKRRATG